MAEQARWRQATRALLLYSAASVTVAAVNGPPEVTVTADGAIPVGPTATLMARGKDPDGDTLSYRWELVGKPPGSGARIESPETAAAGLRPDRTGRYRVVVRVSDGVNEVTRVLNFDAVHPGQTTAFKPLPAQLRKPAARRTRERRAVAPLPACPTPRGTETRAAVVLGWRAPLHRVDGKPLGKQLRFRLYRALLPDNAADCVPHRHCLKPLAMVGPGQPGQAQRFTDSAPPAGALCYAVISVPSSGHESAMSNYLLVPTQADE